VQLVGTAEKGHEVARLALVSPPQEFDFEARLPESFFGFLDLGLEAAVREQEG
jgi:hypothetical protein